MKNNLFWGVGIVVIVILLAILLGTSSGGEVALDTTNKATDNASTTVTTKTPTKTPATPAPVAGMKTSLGGIFNEKGSYQCDYESVTPQTRTSNVVYISDGKMRGEFRTIEASASKATLVVYDGSYLYVWTEGYPTGTVSQPKTISELPGIIPEDVASGKILGSGLNSVSWNCHAWARDASKLVKPSYVKFN